MTATVSQKNAGKKAGNRGKAPGSAAHHFQPGQSGNPEGKKKGTLNYKTVALQVWEEVAQEQADAYNRKYAKSIAAKQRPAKTAADFNIPALLIKKHTIMALAGSEKALDSVQDRFFGKAVQTIAGDPENPIEFSQESRAERAARMLSMFDVPVIEDEEDEEEQDEVEPAAAPAPKKAAVKKKPAAPKAKDAKLPAAITRSMPKARPMVSRRPAVNRYAKKK